jgi:hypothetical protein
MKYLTVDAIGLFALIASLSGHFAEAKAAVPFCFLANEMPEGLYDGLIKSEGREPYSFRWILLKEKRKHPSTPPRYVAFPSVFKTTEGIRPASGHRVHRVCKTRDGFELQFQAEPGERPITIDLDSTFKNGTGYLILADGSRSPFGSLSIEYKPIAEVVLEEAHYTWSIERAGFGQFDLGQGLDMSPCTQGPMKGDAWFTRIPRELDPNSAGWNFQGITGNEQCELIIDNLLVGGLGGSYLSTAGSIFVSAKDAFEVGTTLLPMILEGTPGTASQIHGTFKLGNIYNPSGETRVRFDLERGDSR